MKNAVLTILATVLVPGLAVFLVPYWILHVTGRLSGPAFGLLGAASIALVILGAVMVIWVSLTFATRGKGTPVPVAPPQVLVAEGLYRFVRNPMYVGALLVLAAEALLFRSAWILLYAGFLWLALHTFAVLIEEPDLERRFGDSYRQYKESTPRWIPRPPAKK